MEQNEIIDGMVKQFVEATGIEAEALREGVSVAFDVFEKMLVVATDQLTVFEERNGDDRPLEGIRDTVIASAMSVTLMFLMKRHHDQSGKNSWEALRASNELYQLAKAMGDDVAVVALS